jgi:hypothetical protein
MVTFGFFAVKSLTSWSAILTVSEPLSTRKDSVTLPSPPLSSLLPRLPALHAVSASEQAAVRASVICRVLIGCPPGERGAQLAERRFRI